MTTLSHKGYVAEIEAAPEHGVFHGRTVNTHAVLTFEGSSLPNLQREFAATVADYEDWCRERGVEPEKPYSGRLALRLTPELHRKAVTRAASEGMSVNSWIAHRIEAA